MNAGKDGQSEDQRIKGRKVISSTGAGFSRQNYGGHRYNLHNGADFPQKRWQESAKPGDDIDSRGANQNENVATNHCDGNPEGYGEVLGNRRWIDAPHGEHDKRRNQHQFVGDQIQNPSQRRLLMKPSSEQAVEPVSDAGNDEYSERPNEPLIKEHGNKNGNQRHPEDSQEIRHGDDSRRHEGDNELLFAEL